MFVPVIVPQPRCHKCGHKVGRSYRFCPGCGEALPLPASKATDVNAPMILVGLVLMTVMGVVFFFLVRSL